MLEINLHKRQTTQRVQRNDLTDLPKLRLIDVSETSITDQSLARLHRFPALEFVFAVGCLNLSSAGVMALRQAAPQIHVVTSASAAPASP